MKSEFPLDYAVFQLSPRRSRFELFVSYDGTTEKIASGLLKPFVTHLKAAKEQAASSVKSITLEVEDSRSSETWFTKGTLERFVLFVSNPEVLELVSTFDAEVSQLEAARKIYSQEPGKRSGPSVCDGGTTTASDATKKELLHAIDVRLTTVRQDVSTACALASAAGFNPDTVLELQHLANQFGAYRLRECCYNFISLCQRRSELFPVRNSRVHDQAIRSSSVTDKSLDEIKSANKPSILPSGSNSSREPSIEKGGTKYMSDMDCPKKDDTSITKVDSGSPSTGPRPPVRQLSVQERISLFENKQQQKSSSGSGSKPVIGNPVELSRLSSDVSSASQMGRRLNGAGYIAPIKTSKSFVVSDDMDGNVSIASANSSMPETKEIENESELKNECLENNSGTTKLGVQLTVLSDSPVEVFADSKSTSFYRGSESDGPDGLKDQCNFLIQSKASFDDPEDFSLENQINSLAVPRKSEQFSSVGSLSSSEEEAVPSFVAHKACDIYEDTADPEDVRSRNKKVPKSRLKTFQEATIDRVSTSDSSVVSHKSESDQMVTTSHKSSIESRVSGSHKMKFQRHSSASAYVKKSRGKRDDNGPGSRIPGFTGKISSDNQESISSIPSKLMDQGQRVKQSKGNQDLNNELKQKANELEKLFAAHKSTVSRGIKPSVDVSTPQPASIKDFDNTPKQVMHGLGISDQNKGKLYNKYTKKRDAKLKEEWSSNRAEKEARLKFLQDSLERSSSEIKSKFAGLSDSQDSYRRSEKLRSFTSPSGVRQKQPIHSFLSDADEDQAEFTLPASRYRKGLVSSAGRKKLQQENPAAQSVPNLAEFRKDNMGATTSASKGAEMPAALPSPFPSMASGLESPGESPGSWHSRIHNPYLFKNEISVLDASVDSPIGSPAYWSTNDSDAEKMRKKWGASPKIVVSDSSHSQSRKDVTKGLKRFLKFGRKNHGTDSLADGVSVTTSEGDDDTDDGKDPAGNKSLEDFRKSRLGFVQYNNDDGFSESDSFSEQVQGFPNSSPFPPMNFKSKEDNLSGSPLKGIAIPSTLNMMGAKSGSLQIHSARFAPKSFFSLSTFRSKGSDSKPR